MTIVDDEIQALVGSKSLITDFDAKNLINCRYNLRAAQAFLPKTGEEVIVGKGRINRYKKRDCWVIKPSETMVIMTKEKVKIPLDMYASYSQLDRLARKGLMLVNVSIVEPGYEGPLSCFLVNFSRDSIDLYPEDDIAKICFHKLTKAPANPSALIIQEDSYKRKLVESAKLYPTSFMDIGGVEERIVDRATKSVNQSIKIAVAFIAVLVIWTTLEPLTNKFLWEKLGVKTNTQQLEMMKLQQDLEKIKNDLSTASNDLKSEKKINELEEKLNNLQKPVGKR